MKDSPLFCRRLLDRLEEESLTKMKNIIIVFIFTIIPPISQFLSREESILDNLQKIGLLGDLASLAFIKQIIILLGIVLPPLFLSIKWQYAQYKFDHMEKQRSAMLTNLKDTFLTVLESKIPKTTFRHVNIRIFVEKRTIITRVQRYIERLTEIKFPKKFVMKNIKGMSENGFIHGLEYEVSPTIEGMVGKCYNERKMDYAEDLIASTEAYNMSDYQMSLTRDVDFVLCSPIVDKYGNVIAVVSLDSKDHIIIPKASKPTLETFVSNFCFSLYNTIPEIFEMKKG